MKKFVFMLALMPLWLMAESPNLRAEIQLSQGEGVNISHSRLQPLFPVHLSVVVKNLGDAPSNSGKIAIHYALPHPYENEREGILFTTEDVRLPALEPKEEYNISFKAAQPLPTLADFVRQDWAMRQYQAVFRSNTKEEIIGTLAITYSAYYYPLNAPD